jgi:two-component system, chemotaxis family, protein-glutamate methylesterase/glutaminase
MMVKKTKTASEGLAISSFDVVAIAASAGGLNAINVVLANRLARFPTPIVVVQHLDPHHRSLMVEILSRNTPLRVKQAEDGEIIQPGTVYVAPPDRHLLVNSDRSLALSQSELVHFLRPSADPLIESVAVSHKERRGVVLVMEEEPEEEEDAR